MVYTLHDIAIVVSLGGLGILWAAATVGMLLVGWNTIAEPIADRFKDRDQDAT
jgi:hypothetical protein